MAFLLLVSDLGYLGSQSTLPTYTSHDLGRGGLGRSLCPRPLGGKGCPTCRAGDTLTRESTEYPKAEVELSPGGMRGPPGRALRWPSLAAAWKPVLIMASTDVSELLSAALWGRGCSSLSGPSPF